MTFREEFVANLPADPAEAIVILADRAQMWLDTPDTGNASTDSIYIRTIFKRFLERYSIGFTVESSDDDDPLPSISDYLKAITRFAGHRVVDRLLDAYDVERGDPQFGVATLTSDEKSDIHSHIDAIRTIIEESDLSARKKNALFGRLNGLAQEVDREGTRTDRFFAFAADAAFVLGDMDNQAEPFLKEVKDILKIVSRARAKNEGVALPPGEEILKLPSPNKSKI
jgi:hypothetical protein